MAQFLRPDGVISQGAWTGSNTNIDEVSASDSDFVTSDDNTSPDVFEVSLSDATDPAVSTGHIIRWRRRKEATGGHSVTLTVDLIQGTTVIATKAVLDPSATFASDSYTLTGTEADNITDYNDLRLRFTRSGDTGGNPSGRRFFEVSWAELEIPDASTPPLELAGALTTSSTISGGGTIKVSTSTSLSTSSAISGDVVVYNAIQASVNGSSSTSGDLGIVKGLDSAITGTTTTASDLTIAYGLTANVAGASSIVSNLLSEKDIASNINGVSAVSGQAVMDVSAIGTVGGLSTISANATIGSTLELSGAINQGTVIGGDAIVYASISSNIVSNSTIQGEGVVYGAVLSSINTASSLAGDVLIYEAISSGINTASTTSGDLSTGNTQELSASISSNSTIVSGALIASGIASSIVGSSILVGQATVYIQLGGVVTTDTALLGDLSVGNALELSGSLAPSSIINGLGVVYVAIDSGILGSSIVGGDAEIASGMTLELQGNISCNSILTGGVSILTNLVAEVTGSSVVVGALSFISSYNLLRISVMGIASNIEPSILGRSINEIGEIKGDKLEKRNFKAVKKL